MRITPGLRGGEFGLESVTSPDHYIQLNVIGNGAYGTVYKACHRTNENTFVALKKIKVPLTEEGIPMSMLREISTLKLLDQYAHPNIIRLLDVCHGRRLEKEQQLVLFLVFEHVDQDLSEYMQNCPPPGLPSDTVKNLMHQILHGIDFLHSHRILHRDLKPQNLLITNDGIVKLADFGLAKTYDFEMRLTSVVVTLWYRSPEVLLGCPYATPVDIWSLGCIMGEMYKNSPLFAGSSEGDQLDRIFRTIGTPLECEWPEEVSVSLNSFARHLPRDIRTIIPEICPEGKDLLEQMLEFDPRKRIGAYEALQHPYFSDSTYSISQESNTNSPNGRAKLLLKKKRYQEQLLLQTDGQLENLEKMIQDLEYSKVEMRILEGLKVGNEALKKMNEAMNIDEIERIMEETAEGIEKQREINELLNGKLSQEDEEAVDREYEELMRLEREHDEKQIILPEVPSEDLEPVFTTLSKSVDSFDKPRVQTDYGEVVGTRGTTLKGRGYNAFYAIPYADKPFRFEEAREPKPWTKPLDGSIPPPDCKQFRKGMPSGSEDCLYLNIFSPTNLKNSSEPLPVTIFVHGGAFYFYSSTTFGPRYLLDKDIILVTINYRIGIFGFLCTEDEVVPGNNGMKDQVMAFGWVQRNIAHFGGDPTSVTLLGFSAGAVSIHYHYFSVLSRGTIYNATLVNYNVMMKFQGYLVGGTAFNNWAVQKNSLQKAMTYAESVGCPTSSVPKMVRCLKKAPADKLASATFLFLKFLNTPLCPWGPVVDGGWSRNPFLLEYPIQSILANRHYNVPLVVSEAMFSGLFPVAGN
ncbi:unnamed protein product [Nezara viridula]|uniref:cyclin-dependent kinase n=1 Tax=Nezara viridula TaxID=85310 RepID=A0A9P0HDC1_NEZVI|nr:unnamed protein product [Nezara viridula]